MLNYYKIVNWESFLRKNFSFLAFFRVIQTFLKTISLPLFSPLSGKYFFSVWEIFFSCLRKR